MSVTLKHSKSRRSSSSPREGAPVNVFDAVFKRLEMIECTEIETRAISYGVIFNGFYHGVGFEFNVYVNGQGRLNRKANQNPVWHKPIAPGKRVTTEDVTTLVCAIIDTRNKAILIVEYRRSAREVVRTTGQSR